MLLSTLETDPHPTCPRHPVLTFFVFSSALSAAVELDSVTSVASKLPQLLSELPLTTNSSPVVVVLFSPLPIVLFLLDA